MSDVSFEETNTNDDAFEAEYEAARQEQDAPIEAEDGFEPEGEEQQPNPEDERLTRLEKIAADKSRMAHSERRQRQAAEERAQKLEERLAALERGGSRAEDVDFSKIPSAVDDPIGNLEALRAIAERMTRQEQETQRQTQAQTQQERQFNQINTRMQEYEGDYRALKPDYDDAAKHFREARIAELQEQGYDGDELNTALRTEFVGLVARSMQSGKDPAEVVYKLAQNRGYGADKSKELVDTKPDKLQIIDRGQKASRSASQMRSKSGSPELTPATVANLEGAAFDKAFEALRQTQRRAG